MNKNKRRSAVESVVCAGALVSLFSGAASANVISNTYNTGLTNNVTVSIGGASLTVWESTGNGPFNLYWYDSSSGTSGYDPTYIQYDTSLAGGFGLSFTSSALLPAGTAINGNDTFVTSEVALQNHEIGYTTDGSYSYGCGKYTCWDSYQDVNYSSSYSGALLSSGATTGYIGLALNVGGQTDYGWAELALDSSGGTDGLVDLLAAGYETNGGQSIQAGQLSDDPTEIPQPPTLVLLASGLVGLALLRRRQKLGGCAQV